MKLRIPKSPLGEELIRIFPDNFSFKSGMACAWQAGIENGYVISSENSAIRIDYAGKDDLVLALGDLLASGNPAKLLKKAGKSAPPGKHAKIPALGFRGIMLDSSRNAVATPAFLKDRIARLALMGLNRFCLYTEDTYTVEGEPLFGYARGRYSPEEIRGLVDYGRIWGVTLFPCIQTLGHMEHILKYPHYTPLKDNDMVYNVYGENLYAFIEKTIDAARASYDTDLIHIGMDETFGLGRGLSFKEGEGIHPRKMYVEHVRKVVDICLRKGLKPMMWGDIILGHGGEKKMGTDELGNLPKEILMDYWEYAWNDPVKYSRDLADFKGMGYSPVVSPGVWCWSRFFPAYYKAEANIKALLESAKQAGVKGALNTHWGDDGHECFFDFNLPAHAYFLAQCTEQDDVLSTAKSRFRAICGFDYDAVRSVETIDIAGYKVESLLPYNVGKCFFYDDPAQGLFSGNSSVKPANAFYAKTAKKMAALAKKKGLFQSSFRFAEAFCDFLSVKADLRRQTVAAYKKGDKKGLRKTLADISTAVKKLDKVGGLYRSGWLAERKPFGLEMVEGRIGMQRVRLEYLKHIVQEHLAGRMPKLEELEFEHYSMFWESRNADYQPSVWPEYMLHYSALASRNTIKWW